jgi:hypothetical protein
VKPLIAKGVLEPETITSIVEKAKVLGYVSDQLVVISNGSAWQEISVNSLEVFVHLQMQRDIKGLRRRGRDRNAEICSQPYKLERCLLPLLKMAAITGQLH